MLTGEKMVNSLVDELNEIGMPSMAATLDKVYHSERFLDLDHLTLMSELIGSEYEDKISKRVNCRFASINPPDTKFIGSLFSP